MFGRNSFFFLLLAAAGALPYVTSSAPSLTKSADKDDPAENKALLNPPSAMGDPFADPAPPAASTGWSPAARTAPTAIPTVALEEALRWDVSLAWILGRWPRVSAGLADLDLQGYRVPWVSGTAPDDVAGSLTYYFNQEKRLERITFQGTTGDAARLVTLLGRRFEFRRQLGPDPSLHLYLVRWNGKPESRLQIRASSVVRADQPHGRFNVAMVINNPDIR